MAKLPQAQRFSDKSAPVKMVQELYDIYDYAEFVVGNGISDYNVALNQSDLFKNCKQAWLVVIDHSKDISIKFNDVSMPAISCGYETSPREWRDILKVSNMFITNNSGASATIKVILV